MPPVRMMSPCSVPFSRTEGTFGISASYRVRNQTPRQSIPKQDQIFPVPFPAILCQDSVPAGGLQTSHLSLCGMKSELSQLIIHGAADKENTFEHHSAKPDQSFLLPLYLSCVQQLRWNVGGILKTAFLVSGVVVCRRLRACLVRGAVHCLLISYVLSKPCALSSSERSTRGSGLSALQSVMNLSASSLLHQTRSCSVSKSMEGKGIEAFRFTQGSGGDGEPQKEGTENNQTVLSDSLHSIHERFLV